jgi:hypothetical protein
MRDLVQQHLPELASEVLVQLDAKTRKLREVSSQLDNLVNAIVKKGDSRILLEKLTELEAEKNQLVMEKTVLETQHLNQAETNSRLMESNLAAIAENYQAADPALLLQLLRYLIVQIKVARMGNKIAGEIVFIDRPANETEVSMLSAPTGSETFRIEYRPHKSKAGKGIIYKLGLS